MMRYLSWIDGRGLMTSGEHRMTLHARPAFSFAYDVLLVGSEAGELEHAGEVRALSAAELVEVHAHCALLDGANESALVHGCDGLGRYLGLVPEPTAAHVLDGPPPFAADVAVFDAPSRSWRSVLSPARLALEARRQRNALLQASDWTQGADSPLPEAERLVWRTYRHALRDLPAHPRWPELAPADWPVAPPK